MHYLSEEVSAIILIPLVFSHVCFTVLQMMPVTWKADFLLSAILFPGKVLAEQSQIQVIRLQECLSKYERSDDGTTPQVRRNSHLMMCGLYMSR